MCTRFTHFLDAMNGCIYHCRDKTSLECDAVIHLRNGDYGLIEIKLGGEIAIEQVTATLKKLCDRIDTEKMKEPSILILQFLSTHPCGVRRWLVFGNININRFLSTHPCGVRPIDNNFGFFLPRFLSTNPYGVRHGTKLL